MTESEGVEMGTNIELDQALVDEAMGYAARADINQEVTYAQGKA
jgi:hypothetical protein